MKNALYILIGIGIVILASMWFNNIVPTGGVFQNAPTYKVANATSSVFTTGPGLSVQILGERSLRAYALICNDSADKLYLDMGTSAITATTSASVFVATGTCYEIRSPFIWADAVQAIKDTGAPTTSEVTVFELFDD